MIFPLKYYQSTLITRPHFPPKITATNKKINRWKLCGSYKLWNWNSPTQQLSNFIIDKEQGRISVLRSNIPSSLLPNSPALCCWSHRRSHLMSMIYYIELYDVYDIKKEIDHSWTFPLIELVVKSNCYELARFTLLHPNILNTDAPWRVIPRGFPSLIILLDFIRGGWRCSTVSITSFPADIFYPEMKRSIRMRWRKVMGWCKVENKIWATLPPPSSLIFLILFCPFCPV